MDAEQYKEFEQKLKLADEYDHPLPDEKAWKAMSAKLDDAFNKKKKRRIIWFFILPLTIILAPAIFFLSKDKNDTAELLLTAKKNNIPIALSSPHKPFEKPAIASDSPHVRMILKKHQQYKPVFHAASKGAATHGVRYKKDNRLTDDYTSKPDDKGEDKSQSLNTGSGTKESNALHTSTDSSSTNRSVAHIDSSIQKEAKTHTDTALNSTPAAANPGSVEVKGKQNEGKKISPLSRLYLSASIAPSKSFVSSGNGRWTTAYGGGIGYQIAKRWFVESGVYAGRALYHAGPDDYKWESAYGYKLKSVEADCFIIEIPINLGYTFYEKRRLQLSGTAGLSSQLMKQENYDYTTIRYSMEYKGIWTYKNENKHLISAARVSLGIAYKASNKLSLQAAPYFKKPLKGIGAGEVKLNSAGMSLNVHYFPFFERKK